MFFRTKRELRLLVRSSRLGGFWFATVDFTEAFLWIFFRRKKVIHYQTKDGKQWNEVYGGAKVSGSINKFLGKQYLKSRDIKIEHKFEESDCTIKLTLEQKMKTN